MDEIDSIGSTRIDSGGSGGMFICMTDKYCLDLTASALARGCVCAFVRSMPFSQQISYTRFFYKK